MQLSESEKCTFELFSNILFIHNDTDSTTTYFDDILCGLVGLKYF